MKQTSRNRLNLLFMRRAALFIQLLAIILSAIGCRSTMIMQPTTYLTPFNGGAKLVYVTNSDMQPEYDILKAAKIYQLTNQPGGARKLTLHRIRLDGGGCANPLALSILTLGIVPGYLPSLLVFEYDLEENGTSRRCIHQLPIYDRYSTWDWLIRHDDRKVFADALPWSSLKYSPEIRSQRSLRVDPNPNLESDCRYHRARLRS